MTPSARYNARHMEAPRPETMPAETRGLLARLRAGDVEAAEVLFTIHRDRLLRAMRLRLPPEMRRHIDDDDICQTTILKALRKLDRFEYRGEGSFLAWLVRIADRAVRDSLRAHHRRKNPDVEIPVADSQTPSRDAVHREDLERLGLALDSLQKSDRELLIDSEILGVDLDEIAARIGKSREATRVTVYRAKNRLARWFEKNT